MTITLVCLIALLAIAVRIRIIPADVRIVDGDTIQPGPAKWRIAGYDAPEWDQPHGRRATSALCAIMREGRSLAILGRTDAYGRPVAAIITRRGPLAWRMTAGGHGHGEGVVPSILTTWARLRRNGMWDTRDAVLMPKTWRAGIRP